MRGAGTFLLATRYGGARPGPGCCIDRAFFGEGGLVGWMRKRVAVAGICGVLLSVVVPGPGLGAASTVRTGKRMAECPDPTILVDGSVLPHVTLMCTGNGFPTRSASSLGRLSGALPHPAFAAGGWPVWATGAFWAPDLEHVGGRYLLYYSARRRGDWRHCIGVAVSNRPDGGFRDLGAPLIGTEADGTIDPALLSVDDRLFLFYKLDRNSVGSPSVIVGRQLSADGLSLVGPQIELLRSRERGWEHGIVEGPAPVQLGKTTYLVYSGGRFYDPGYAEGEAVRTGNPLGRYRRVSAAPVLHANARWVGTAGGSIVADGNRLLLAYAGFRPNEQSLRRLLFIRELRLQNGILRPVGHGHQIPLRTR